MAKGILELKESHEVDVQMENNIQYFLDRFFMSRVSIRMLINQHSKLETGSLFTLPLCALIPYLLFAAILFGGALNGHKRHVGCIDPWCDVIGVVKDAYENARFLCDQYYLASPELVVKQHNGKY